jgi:hypothetical protein
MKELTLSEELDLVKKVIDEELDFFDNGSSRVVFDLGDNKVLKIAMDKQGRLQNQVEVETFMDMGNSHLAEIFSYGLFINVMEYVEVECAEVIEDVYNENLSDEEYYEDYVIEYSDQVQIRHTIDNLCERYGWTDDNFQLGKTISRKENKYVSYDYGYDTNYHRHQIVSNTLTDTMFEKGEYYILERTYKKLKRLLDFSAKKLYNKV